MKTMRIKLFFIGLLFTSPFFHSCISEQVSTTEIISEDFIATIDENPSNNQIIGVLAVSATGGALTLELISESIPNAFSIEGETLRVKEASVFDFETNPQLTAVVQASVAEVSETIDVTVNLNDVAEGGQGLVANDFTIFFTENPEVGSVIGSISASSTNGPVSFVLTSENPVGALSLDEMSGELTVAGASFFDLTQNEVISASAEVTDGLESASVLITINLISAPVIWSGLDFTFRKESNADPGLEENQDRLTDNVWITRNNDGGPIINVQSSSNNSDGPGGTEWAIGTTDQIEELQFSSLRSALNGGRGVFQDIVGKDMVLHLVEDNIYLDIRFTSWAQGRQGGFAYIRSSEN